MGAGLRIRQGMDEAVGLAQLLHGQDGVRPRGQGGAGHDAHRGAGRDGEGRGIVARIEGAQEAAGRAPFL